MPQIWIRLATSVTYAKICFLQRDQGTIEFAALNFPDSNVLYVGEFGLLFGVCNMALCP